MRQLNCFADAIGRALREEREFEMALRGIKASTQSVSTRTGMAALAAAGVPIKLREN